MPNINPTASTLIRPNIGYSTAQDETSSGANATKKHYWQLTIDELQEEDLLIAEEIKGVQQAAVTTGNTDFTAQLLYTTQQV
jgi:hypothetical protein